MDDVSEPFMTDEQLAVLVQKGDKDKFGPLMERYEKKLLRYGRRFLSRTEHIEDIVQEVFISTYQNIKSFDPNQRFSPWIYRIAHNAFVNGLKKTIKDPLMFFDFDTLISHPVYEDPTPREQEQKELNDVMEKCLDKLPTKYKEVVVLYYYEEMSYKEIADILRIPAGTVGIRLKRAKDALKKIYEKLQKKHGTE